VRDGGRDARARDRRPQPHPPHARRARPRRLQADQRPLGHAAGDALLSELASAWRGSLRAGDILARHGADEFVLLLPATSESEAGEVLERLRRGTLRRIGRDAPRLAHGGASARGGDPHVGWSIGLSEWRAAEALDSVLARADRDLYRVKQALRGAPPQTAGYRVGSLLPST
jgi:diguanylate cyclase (GGDEF)-like protein